MHLANVDAAHGCKSLAGSTTERQIVASLDQIHREMVSHEPCSWDYDGGKDVYSCPHIALAGKVVIERVEGFNRYSINIEESHDFTSDSTPTI